jgi:hypothetical protein
MYHPKHVEQFPDKINCLTLHLVAYTGYTKKNGVEKKLLPQLNKYDDYIVQQRWIGRAAKGDNHLFPWSPRSPDLTPCDLFLLGVR